MATRHVFLRGSSSSFLYLLSVASATSRDSSLDILVSRNVTSRVTRRSEGSNLCSASMWLIKSVVSLMKDGRCMTNGLRMKSTRPEIHSVGQLFALTIGLPGGGHFSLWILGRN